MTRIFMTLTWIIVFTLPMPISGTRLQALGATVTPCASDQIVGLLNVDSEAADATPLTGDFARLDSLVINATESQVKKLNYLVDHAKHHGEMGPIAVLTIKHCFAHRNELVAKHILNDISRHWNGWLSDDQSMHLMFEVMGTVDALSVRTYISKSLFDAVTNRIFTALGWNRSVKRISAQRSEQAAVPAATQSCALPHRPAWVSEKPGWSAFKTRLIPSYPDKDVEQYDSRPDHPVFRPDHVNHPVPVTFRIRIAPVSYASEPPDADGPYGTITDAAVVKSSGNKKVDELAEWVLRRFVFRPALDDCTYHPSEILFTVTMYADNDWPPDDF